MAHVPAADVRERFIAYTEKNTVILAGSGIINTIITTAFSLFYRMIVQ